MANVQILSNVKIVTSGTAPTTENLLTGQAAFGKLTSDGKYHLWGNSDGQVVDIVLSSAPTGGLTEVPDLNGVLTAGNTSAVDIQIKNGTDVTIISKDYISTTDGTRELKVDPLTGFTDAGQPVLSANSNNTINSSQAETMRNFLVVYSKSEVDAKITGVYKYKGTIDTFANLITKAEYTPVVGDVWNIETAGGTDKNGTAIKAGDNVAFVGPEKTTDWDVLSGIVDLTNYYTKGEVDGIKSTLEGKISTAQSTASSAQTAAQGAQSDIDALTPRVTTLENAGYQTATQVQQILTTGHYVSDESYVHTDNNYTTTDKTKVSKILTNGSGTKVLTDDGTYQTLELTVVSI